jgi:hypothetical protein
MKDAIHSRIKWRIKSEPTESKYPSVNKQKMRANGFQLTARREPIDIQTKR